MKSHAAKAGHAKISYGNANSLAQLSIDMNNYKVSAVHLAALSVFMGLAPSLNAQGYEPIIENFRLGASDQLVIDRGGPVDRAGDVNGDNLEDLLVGTGVGGIRVVFGPTNGNNGVLNGQQLDGASGFVILNDAVNDSVVAGLGDINGDGLDDIGVVSVTGARVVFGSDNGFNRTLDVATLNGANGFAINTGATDIKRAGDVNGDGLADFVIGNANASPNGLTGAGVSYVIYGSADGFPALLQTSDLDGNNGFAVVGISAQDRAGLFVSGAGDFNNDGFDDVLIGAPNQTTDGKSEAGAAYLISGGDNFPSAISLADVDGSNGLVFKGSDIQDLAGRAVAAIGDLNHDGIDDLAIGAPGKGPFGVPSDYPGETYVLFGGNFEGVALVTEADLNGNNGLVLRGIRGGVIPIEEGEPIWGDLAGTDIDAAGDMNGDGVDDMIIGAPHTIINPSRKGVGQAYIVYGSNSAYPARLQLADLDGSNGFRINGTGTVDYYAVSVAGAGDFNDDGRDDVMMGASGQGETYVFYGRDTGNVSVGGAPDGASGSPSSGFTAAALTLGTEAQPLAFNERADPTGPNPLPEGTPTDPLDPASPGFTAPFPLNTEQPARPGDSPTTVIPDIDEEEGTPGAEVPETPVQGTPGTEVPETPVQGAPVTEPPETSDGSTPVTDQSETPDSNTPDAELPNDGTSSGVVEIGGGAILWIALLLSLILLARSRAKYLSVAEEYALSPRI